MVLVKLPRSERSLHYVSDKLGNVTPHVELIQKITELGTTGIEKGSDTIQINDHLDLNVQNTNLT